MCSAANSGNARIALCWSSSAAGSNLPVFLASESASVRSRILSQLALTSSLISFGLP
jgi:hypothetical protein